MIVPLFNGMPHLEALLPTIRSQNDEIHRCIFIDDVSSDDTLERVRACSIDRAIIVENEANVGLYGTLNKAMSLVETELIALVFQDDVLYSSYAVEMKRLAARCPEVNFFTSGFDRIDERGNVLSRSSDRTGREWNKIAGVASWRDVLVNGASWIISGSVSRTAALRKYGFRADLPQCGDFDFFVRAARDESFVYFDKTLVEIREHAAQASAGNLPRSIDLVEKIGVIGENRRLWRKDFSRSLTLRLLTRYSGYIFARSLGQLRRRRLKACWATLALFPQLLSVLLGPIDDGGDAGLEGRGDGRAGRRGLTPG